MTHIFHIAELDDWETALATGEYQQSTRNRSLSDVGFIHCSHAHQVEGVANAFYRDAGPLVLLEIDVSRLASRVVREESVGSTETFPHLYGPLPTSAVVAATPLARGEDGRVVFGRFRAARPWTPEGATSRKLVP